MSEPPRRAASPRRAALSLSIVSLAAVPGGCAPAPAAPVFSIFGSFFPAWIVCALIGVVVTLVLRAVFVRIGLDEHLPVRLLVYVGLTVLSAIAVWAVLFAGVTP